MAKGWRAWAGVEAAPDARAESASAALAALPAVMPRISVWSGKQVNGYLVEFMVEGELVWKVWRATEPSSADLLDLKVAAATGIAARGHCAIGVLATDVQAFFGGAAPAPDPAPAPEEPKEAA